MSDLAIVTTSLGKSYEQWKTAEMEKNTDKDKFFDYATEESKTNLAEWIVLTDRLGQSDEQVIERIERFNPTGKVDDWRDTDDSFEAILIEDPSLKPFTYVNREDEMVYTRQVSKGKAQIDDEYMQKADPDLYEQITFELPWGERVMIPLTTLDKETVSKVQKYMYHTKPSVKLAPPREAKPEELE